MESKMQYHSYNLNYVRGANAKKKMYTDFHVVGKMHLYSTPQKNRFLVLPYLVWHVILLGYYLGVTIFLIIVWNLVCILASGLNNVEYYHNIGFQNKRYSSIVRDLFLDLKFANVPNHEGRE